jgi:thiol peroxidase
VIDKQGMIRYIQIVPEVTHEPDYTAALEAARKVM